MSLPPASFFKSHDLFNSETLNFDFRKVFSFNGSIFQHLSRLYTYKKRRTCSVRTCCIDGFVPLFEKSFVFYKLFNFRDKNITRVQTEYFGKQSLRGNFMYRYIFYRGFCNRKMIRPLYEYTLYYIHITKTTLIQEQL